MRRLVKLTVGYVIIRLLTEYLRPLRVRLEEQVGPPPLYPEPAPPAPPPTGPARLNLNQADASTLTTLPGVGPALAERITAYRQQAGPFASLDDLTQVRGIGPALMERLRPQVTLN